MADREVQRTRCRHLQGNSLGAGTRRHRKVICELSCMRALFKSSCKLERPPSSPGGEVRQHGSPSCRADANHSKNPNFPTGPFPRTFNVGATQTFRCLSSLFAVCSIFCRWPSSIPIFQLARFTGLLQAPARHADASESTCRLHSVDRHLIPPSAQKRQFQPLRTSLIFSVTPLHVCTSSLSVGLDGPSLV